MLHQEGTSKAPLAKRVIDRIGRRPETPVVLCVDVEPDPRVFDRADPVDWAGFERLMERIAALRERLSEATGKPAAFTWFLRMDPQVAETWGSPIWPAEKYGDTLTALTEQGDELGLHTHFWRWGSRADEWFADYQDPGWAEHCVTMGLESFETAFGRGCTAHRGGDHFLSGALLSILSAYGVKVDLSVEPGPAAGCSYCGGFPWVLAGLSRSAQPTVPLQRQDVPCSRSDHALGHSPRPALEHSQISPSSGAVPSPPVGPAKPFPAAPRVGAGTKALRGCGRGTEQHRPLLREVGHDHHTA
jgi:hypothetical protein